MQIKPQNNLDWHLMYKQYAILINHMFKQRSITNWMITNIVKLTSFDKHFITFWTGILKENFVGFMKQRSVFHIVFYRLLLVLLSFLFYFIFCNGIVNSFKTHAFDHSLGIPVSLLIHKVVLQITRWRVGTLFCY